MNSSLSFSFKLLSGLQNPASNAVSILLITAALNVDSSLALSICKEITKDDVNHYTT